MDTDPFMTGHMDWTQSISLITLFNQLFKFMFKQKSRFKLLIRQTFSVPTGMKTYVYHVQVTILLMTMEDVSELTTNVNTGKLAEFVQDVHMDGLSINKEDV